MQLPRQHARENLRGALMAVDLNLLAQVPFFQLMDDEERRELSRHVEIIKKASGEVLFHVGETGDSLYVIYEGEVEVFVKDTTGRKIVLEVASVGQFLGELSLLDGGPRTASVVVTQDLCAIRIDRNDLHALFKAHPEAALDFIAAMGKRLRASSHLLRYTSVRNANHDSIAAESAFEKLADMVTKFTGSMSCLWLHIIFFTFWIFWNTGWVEGLSVIDPFPFTFLTTTVSLEAIVLTIFVLLSQNRQATKDRLRSDVEYDVNLKAELEIRHLHEKVDELTADLFKKLSNMEQKIEPAPSSRLA